MEWKLLHPKKSMFYDGMINLSFFRAQVHLVLHE